jgi:hypothetical protein
MKKINRAWIVTALLGLLAGSASAQSPPAAVQAGLPAAAEARPANSGQPKTAEKPAAGKSVVLDEEMRELLADRQLIFHEIERIASAHGEAVKIPVSIRELERRAAAKWQKFQAWLKLRGVPEDWAQQGWRFDAPSFTLHPPAPPEKPAEKSPEKKP